MIFTQQQIIEILKTVDMNTKYLTAKILGLDVLSEQDKKTLTRQGFKLSDLPKHPTFLQSYHFGRLSQLIGDLNTKKITYGDFMQHLQKGQYIPMNEMERYSYEVAKNRTYSHITGLGEGMKKDMTNVIRQTEQERRADYEKVIKGELEKGVVDRKGLKEIVSDLGHKTGDWSRNFGRIVDTEMNNIYQQGRADMVKRRHGSDAKVYKDVFPGVCRHCIKAYTTNGIGSKPRIFKVSKLEANGTNIGRKVAEWQPIIGSHHPHCRCTLRHILQGQSWNPETERFEFSKEGKEKYKDLPKIKVKIGSKEFEV